MQIKIKATKIKLTPEIEDYIQEKMDMLEKYLGQIKVMNCDVEIGLVTSRHQKGEIYRTEVNLEVPGTLIRIEKSESDLFKSVDKVKDHLMRSIKKYKEKMIRKRRKG